MKEKPDRIPTKESVDFVTSGEGFPFILEVLGKRAKREGWSNDKLAEKISAFAHTSVRLQENIEDDS